MNSHTVDLPNEIPPGTLFEKLRESNSYRCAEWKHDRRGIFCMYYEFSVYKKRIPLSEIEAAVLHLQRENIFDRNVFASLCPISHSDGTCGFVVIGRILEKFFNAEYMENSGFTLEK